MEVVEANTMGDSSGVNTNGRENGKVLCMSTSFSPEQVALFNLRYKMDMTSLLILNTFLAA